MRLRMVAVGMEAAALQKRGEPRADIRAIELEALPDAGDQAIGPWLRMKMTNLLPGTWKLLLPTGALGGEYEVIVRPIAEAGASAVLVSPPVITTAADGEPTQDGVVDEEPGEQSEPDGAILAQVMDLALAGQPLAQALKPRAPMIEHAQAAIARGLHVHPLIRRGTGERVSRGLASNDSDIVAAWWGPSGDAEANLGISTGAGGGVWVLEVKGQEGEDSLALWEGDNGKCPETYEVRFDGGRHLYFGHPGGLAVIPTMTEKRPGLAIYGERSTVVGAGSQLRDGGEYWLHGDHAVAETPSWLFDMVKSPASFSAGTPSEPSEESASEGDLEQTQRDIELPPMRDLGTATTPTPPSSTSDREISLPMLEPVEAPTEESPPSIN